MLKDVCLDEPNLRDLSIVIVSRPTLSCIMSLLGSVGVLNDLHSRFISCNHVNYITMFVHT